MATEQNAAVAQEMKEPDSEMTTANASVMEKSPSPEATSEEVNEQGEPAAADAPPVNPEDGETEYPGTVTKIGVGVGLGLAVFLVRSISRRVNEGCSRSDDCRDCDPQNL
jgi:hypothetical protein